MPRTTAGLVVVFFASLPLQWQILASTPLGVVRWFHLTGLVLVLALSHRRYRGARRQVRHEIRLLAAEFTFYTIALVAFSWYHGIIPAEPLQQALYAVMGFFMAVFFTADHGWKTVRYVAPAALVTYAVAFYLSATAAGVNVVATLRTALVNIDPAAIRFALFRATFGEGSQANVRHEIYAGLLVAAYVSLYANRRLPARGWRRIVVVGSVTAIFVLIALSQSRAVTLAALFPPAVAVVRWLISGRVSTKQAAVIAATLALVPLAVVASVPQLLWNRFITDTASYEGRSIATSAAVDDVFAYPLVGRGDPAVSSHNFLLDAAVRGGFVTALLALAVFGLICFALGKATLRYLRSSSVPLPALAAAAVVVVRMLTAGGGTLHLVEWVGLGFFYSVWWMSDNDNIPSPGGEGTKVRAAGWAPPVTDGGTATGGCLLSRRRGTPASRPTRGAAP